MPLACHLNLTDHRLQLAARLTEDPSVSVLLLEAGGSAEKLPINVPVGSGASRGDGFQI